MGQRVGGVQLPAVAWMGGRQPASQSVKRMTKLGQVGVGAPNPPIHPHLGVLERISGDLQQAKTGWGLLAFQQGKGEEEST